MVHQTFYKLPEEKRRRITDSAMDEFTSRPYEKTSINRIIEAARIPKGSFYQYFDSKDDLYAYCVKELSRRLLEQRRERHEGLLDTGLHRASRVGMGQAVDEYNAELNSMLGEKGLRPERRAAGAAQFSAAGDRRGADNAGDARGTGGRPGGAPGCGPRLFCLPPEHRRRPEYRLRRDDPRGRPKPAHL